jgi:hypothetical protein
MQDQMPPQDDSTMPEHEIDREGAMAKADLYKLANYSLKLFKQIQDEDQLEGWVQAKITKAADYIASVYHYLEYEMKFSEYGHHLDNSDTLSEGQKQALKGKLMEAKEKMKELKKKQADKAKGKKEKDVEENLTVVPNPSGAKDAEEAKKLGAMMPKPAGAEKDPIKEESSSTGGTITRTKTGLRHSHNPDRFTDEPHGEVASKVKARSASDKAGEKAQDKADEKESKAWGKANPGKQTIMKGGVKTTNEAKGKKPDFLDMDKDGDKKEPMKKAVADKKAGPKKGVNPFAKKTNEALKGNQKKLDADDDGDIEADDLADLRAGKKAKKMNEGMAGHEAAHYHACKCAENYAGGNLEMAMHHKDMCEQHGGTVQMSQGQCHHSHPHINGGAMYECGGTMMYEGKAKPSAGLTKTQKSATVKDAKAGKDIGKPGKSFDKVAKAAGGGEKGKKIAAAAMWKNKAKAVKGVEENLTVVPNPSGAKDAEEAKKLGAMMPKPAGAEKDPIRESAELNRMKEFLTRLNG